ncbi:MAG: carboxylesterase/lipase family protein [Corynebacterium sp.]|uniref:carboxylesterase/lipase family protein n=1 Tax=Corynebacterium sp. TaxID=1720 RepID=UPI0026DDCADB|nr:carboxylesterase/lipase family protein [Corynebacterium sp.]MDO4762206.1 carboxylesterase/lipase family protein [Corynebacterium sp.]
MGDKAYNRLRRRNVGVDARRFPRRLATFRRALFDAPTTRPSPSPAHHTAKAGKSVHPTLRPSTRMSLGKDWGLSPKTRTEEKAKTLLNQLAQRVPRNQPEPDEPTSDIHHILPTQPPLPPTISLGTTQHTGDDDLIVDTTAGKIQGLRLEIPVNVTTWRGVPYGADTSGKNRFRAPKPPQPWAGVRDCTHYGAIAAQPTLSPGEKIKGSEDCLNLDIVRPDTTDTLPVVVYFHGGSFIYGSSHQQVLRGHYLVEAMNVVYVSLNFRLGALGYLDYTHFGDDCVANPAIWDHLLALRWIKNNIARFGGDPNNITIMGESAGGQAVLTLMCVPAAQGLFHRAIAQSAPAAAVHSYAQSHFWAHELISRAGFDPDNPPQLDELRELPLENLINAGQSMLWRSKELLNLNSCYSVTVDNQLLHDHPIAIFRAGEQHKVPLMIGTNADETSLAKSLFLRPTARTEAAWRMLQGYDRDAAETIMSFYNNCTKRNDYAQLIADGVFWAPSVIVASAHALTAPTWMYRFDFAPAALKWLGVGAAHTAELSPVFGDLEGSKAATFAKLGGWDDLTQLKTTMQQHWAQFIHSGNPNGADTTNNTAPPSWPAYRPASDTTPGRATKIFDTTAYLLFDPNKARRVAWENYNMLQWGNGEYKMRVRKVSYRKRGSKRN